jgi:hypothetical protein
MDVGKVETLGEVEQTARYAVKHGEDRTGAIGLLLVEYDRRGVIVARIHANRGADVTGTAYERGWRDALSYVLGESS